jgi:3-hydroxyacyl-[acyl-carrier-protein] dehydratase
MSHRIEADHPCLPGHFPGAPLVPAVVILERVIEEVLSEHPGQRVSALPQVKFLAPLAPEQTFTVHCTTGNGGRINFHCDRDGERLVEGCLQLQSL